MEKLRKLKFRPTLGNFFFSSPEQKLIRFLLSEPTTCFTPRVLSSKLKGVRGLGGSDGITQILAQLADLGFVQFVDNNRAVRIQNDTLAVQLLKKFCAICDLEGIKLLVEPVSSKGVLFGSRATGLCRSDSYYDLFVVTDGPDEVKRIVTQHPLGKKIELVVHTPDQYLQIDKANPSLATRVSQGIVVWGSAW